MLDYQAFKDSVSELEDFYGTKILNGGILEATWYQTLKTLSLRELQTAIARCFKKHPKAYNFFPSSGQIFEFAKGEYRPPGENSIVELDPSRTLESREAKMTPEQIKESEYRGRLQAKVIVYSTGFMSLEEKDDLIKRMKQMSTFELEHMAHQAELGHQGSKIKKPSSTMESVEDILSRTNNFN